MVVDDRKEFGRNGSEMTAKLTFNKPAVRQFIEEGAHGLKIKIEDGVAMFKPSTNREGPDVAKLEPRTRGGYEATVEGTGVDDLMQVLKNPHGPFFVLKRSARGYVSAHPWPNRDAPPKFEPHVRVWHSKASTKKTAAKTEAKPSAATKKPTQDIDYLERVRWAYGKLAETPRPGRPSKDIVEARQIKEAFEHAAFDLISHRDGEPQIDVHGLLQAYELIGTFLRAAAPEAMQALEQRMMAPKAEAVSEPKHEPEVQQNDETLKRDLHKLGLDDQTPQRQSRVPRRQREAVAA